MTQNHWVACASCHLEGRSDAVTWQVHAGAARHADERRRLARHRVSCFAPPIAHECRTIGGPSTSSKAGTSAGTPRASAATRGARGVRQLRHSCSRPAVFRRDTCGRGSGACRSAERDRESYSRGSDAIGVTAVRQKRTRARATRRSIWAGRVVSSELRAASCFTRSALAAGRAPRWTNHHEDIAGHPRAPCAFDTPQLRGAGTRRRISRWQRADAERRASEHARRRRPSRRPGPRALRGKSSCFDRISSRALISDLRQRTEVTVAGTGRGRLTTNSFRSEEGMRGSLYFSLVAGSRTRAVRIGGAFALALSAIAQHASAAGTWTMAPPNTAAGGQAFGQWLLTDGRILCTGAR